MASHDFCQGCEKCDAYVRRDQISNEVRPYSVAIGLLEDLSSPNLSANERAAFRLVIGALTRKREEIRRG